MYSDIKKSTEIFKQAEELEKFYQNVDLSKKKFEKQLLELEIMEKANAILRNKENILKAISNLNLIHKITRRERFENQITYQFDLMHKFNQVLFNLGTLPFI